MRKSAETVAAVASRLPLEYSLLQMRKSAETAAAAASRLPAESGRSRLNYRLNY
jgi:hypothetical protein